MQAVPSPWSPQTHAHPAAPAASEASSVLFVEEAERKGDRNGGESHDKHLHSGSELGMRASTRACPLGKEVSFIKRW